MKTQTKKILSAFAALTMTAGLMVPVVQAADSITAFSYLNFEDASAFATFNATGATLEENATAAYEGTNSVVVGGGGAGFNMWKSESITGAENGSTISGTIAVKLDQKFYDGDEYEDDPTHTWYYVPSVQVYKGSGDTKVVLAKNDLANTKVLPSVPDKNDPSKNNWFIVNINSTGETFSEEDVITWEITKVGGGAKFRIDDVRFTVTSPEANPSEDTTVAFPILQFENASAFISAEGAEGRNSYGTFTITNEGANKGTGALSTSSSFSLWGGGKATGVDKESTLSGTVAFKLDQPMYDAATSIAGGKTWFLFPSITVKRASDKVVLAELTQADFNISEYTAETWITVDIPSTGETFTSADPLEYTVERPAGGAKIMVDSITFTVTSPAPAPDPEVSMSVTAQSVGNTIRFVTQAIITGSIEISELGLNVKPAGSEADPLVGKYSVDTVLTDTTVNYQVDIKDVPDDDKNTDIEAAPYYKAGNAIVFGNALNIKFNDVTLD